MHFGAELWLLWYDIQQSAPNPPQCLLNLQYSMQHALALESCIDERLGDLIGVLDQRFAGLGKKLNWAEWNR